MIGGVCGGGCVWQMGSRRDNGASLRAARCGCRTLGSRPSTATPSGVNESVPSGAFRLNSSDRSLCSHRFRSVFRPRITTLYGAISLAVCGVIASAMLAYWGSVCRRDTSGYYGRSVWYLAAGAVFHLWLIGVRSRQRCCGHRFGEERCLWTVG